MGVVYHSRGEYDRAIECYERQLRISEELGDRGGIAIAIGNMGLVYASRGEYDRAIECYERQLRIAEELGDRSGIAIAIGNMGMVYYQIAGSMIERSSVTSVSCAAVRSWATAKELP